MPKDLLADLRATNVVPPDSYRFEGFEIPETDTELPGFLQEVEWIRETIDKIQGYVTQLRSKHSEVLSAPQQNEKTKQEIEEITDAIKTSAGQVRLKLKQLEQVIHKQEESDPSAATVRLRRTQLITLSKSFTEAMKNFSAVQVDYKERCKAQLKRQLEVAECPRTDEELEDMLESDNPQIFTQGILLDTQQARQNAADIEARHEDILKLEKSIQELHELFIDLAALVESQNELVDQIDFNVSSTKDHVAGAVVATRKAKEYNTKTRKKKIIIGAVIGGVLLLLVIIIASSLAPRK